MKKRRLNKDIKQTNEIDKNKTQIWISTEDDVKKFHSFLQKCFDHYISDLNVIKIICSYNGYLICSARLDMLDKQKKAHKIKIPWKFYDSTEHKLPFVAHNPFDTWYPAQMYVANFFGMNIPDNRNDTNVSTEEVLELKEYSQKYLNRNVGPFLYCQTVIVDILYSVQK